MADNKTTYDMQFFNDNRASIYAIDFSDRERALTNCKAHYPTGFPAIDDLTDGGFEEGLNFIGAPPSVGKSTFLSQLAYKIAENNPVIFFSLEMPREDIIAKYVSMETYLENAIDVRYAVTSSKLRSAPFIENASKEEWGYIVKSVNAVTDRLQNMWIFDGKSGFTDAESMTTVVNGYLKTSEKRPVVIVDYLQYMSVPEKLLLATDKAKIDYSVSALSALAHNNRLLVFVISSINKADLTNDKSDMAAFSGSGRIIFDADGLYTLNYHDTKNIDEEREKKIRDIDFKIIKQRNCKAGSIVELSFFSMFNFFAEKDKIIDPDKIEEELPFNNKPEDTYEQQTLDMLTVDTV